ncbi:MAG: ATP-binding protein [Thermodesulfobacteriota bacterium]
MDIRSRPPHTNLLLIGALTLVFLGAGLSFLTWQNVRRQEATVREHLDLASRVILRGVEGNLVRELRSRFMGRMHGGPGRGPGGGMGQGRGPGPGAEPGGQAFDHEAARARVQEMFRDLTESEDIVYIAMYAPDGSVMVSSSAGGVPGFSLEPADLRALDEMGEWSGLFAAAGKDVYVAAGRVRAGLAVLCLPDAGAGQADCPGPQGDAPVLVVGVNASRHMAQFRTYRRAALLQTGYLLVSAALLLGLGYATLRRRERDRALRHLERFHSRLLDSMPDGLLTVDPEGRISAANPAARGILGDGGGKAGPGDGGLVGARCEDLPVLQQAMDSAHGTGWVQAEHAGRSLEVLCLPVREARESGEPGEGGEAGFERLVLLRDRTPIAALERDLEEARKLAAIGRLAAGLAHEIRNPLSALRGFAQFFAGKLKGQKPEEDYAATMVREADRLDKVVGDLLYLSRPRTPERRPVDLASLARELETLLALDLGRKAARLRAEFAADRVQADPDLLKQALLNLLINSLDALPDAGGEISLTSRPLADGRIELAVADTGRGMDEAEREQALEPFSTTKKKGTGLGLPMVLKIVRDHGGTLEIASAPGAGATVRLVLPGGDQDAPPGAS